MSKETQKRVIVSGIAIILFYWMVQNYYLVIELFSFILGLIAPFIFGGVIAFVLNVPMKNIEKHLNFKGKFEFLNKVKRLIAYMLTLLCLALIIAIVITTAVPELMNTFKMLIEQIPIAYDKTIKYLKELSSAYPQILEYLSSITIDWDKVISNVSSILSDGTLGALSSGISVISNVIGAVITCGIGFVFSIYLLFQKEKLKVQGKIVIYALLKEKAADKTIEVLQLSNKIFSGFLSGQCTEALIIGVMFFVVMTILKLPYALLMGVVIAISSLIPILGAFIGCVIGILLIFFVNPWQALVFVIVFFALQQIEGNLIYPHVVGNSIGLPSMWVLVAVTIGGSLFGIFGIIIFIPLSSVCYALFRQYVYRRLNEKGVSDSKWDTTE
ncbi:MAG: AI-2E family transporter [Eubacterium sp.]